MKHYGDITKISGYDLPIVDIVTGGSPCQDLSVAGKRAGLAGERSGLFMEQIRIIKEMREHDRANGRTNEHIRPRYMVWENVPGAFSSNKGEDFRAVLEETAKVAEGDASIPGFEGKWPSAGCIMGNGWSIAWRVHDAQFWGVPQRRKRLCMVADFGGQSSGEILFESKMLSGDFEEIRGKGEETSGNISEIAKRSDKLLFRKTAHPINSEMPQGYEQASICDTLNIFDNTESRTPMLILDNHPADSRFKICQDGIFPTLLSRMGTGGNDVNVVLQKKLRRLTPLECERLQGFPDGWTDIGDWIDSKGKQHKGDSDSPRYKALGNSIALPFWEWMAKRMVKYIDAEPTMGSLFDGIGGFPLVFIRAGARPVWASEIDEFPIAVTKIRFQEENDT